jgi:hypothetical protein
MQAQSILGKTTTYLALPAINASYPLFPLFVMLHSLTEGNTTQILANDSLRKIKQTTKLYKRQNRFICFGRCQLMDAERRTIRILTGYQQNYFNYIGSY